MGAIVTIVTAALLTVGYVWLIRAEWRLYRESRALADRMRKRYEKSYLGGYDHTADLYLTMEHTAMEDAEDHLALVKTLVALPLVGLPCLVVALVATA